MNSLVLVGVVLFACATVFILMLAASLLAFVAFRFAPSLNGTILALTTSDVGYMLRQMPVYPAWWPGREAEEPKTTLVSLAVSPVKNPQYFFGFDHLHRSMFCPEKERGIKFDFGDKFVIRQVIHRLGDEGLEIFIVFDKPSRSGPPRIVAASDCRKWYDPRQPHTPLCQPLSGKRTVDSSTPNFSFLRFLTGKPPFTELRTVKHGR